MAGRVVYLGMTSDRPAVSDPGAVPASTAISWLGHSTVLLEIDGTRLLTDPVLRNRIGPLVRIGPELGPDAAGALDAVALSHLHADHTDLPTLRALDRDGPIVAPSAAAGWLGARGLRPVRELAPGDSTTVRGLTVRATPAVHDGRRRPGGPAAATLGFVFGGSSSVYFAGDTDLFDEMEELRGEVDVALLPVWGWGPSVGAGHLDPERAAAAAALISPSVAVPIHWGTFALPRLVRSGMDPARPAQEFQELVRRRAPGVEVRVLAPGRRTPF
jgi:L-ascorbate metabolism protein UlaG (beta-lactamase superfamily)